MKNYIVLNKKLVYSKKNDLYTYLWYRYHKLFFHSLITKGNKLRAFNLFIDLKQNLKLKENIDPFYVFLVAMIKITPEILLFPKN